MEGSKKGLTTTEALTQIHDDVEKVLNEYKSTYSLRNSKTWLYDALHHKSKYTTLTWISVLFIITSAIILSVSYILDPTQSAIPNIVVFMLLFLSIDLYLVIFDNKHRHNEIPNRVSAILATLKLAIKNVRWEPENYPDLCSPLSPCVTLQWVYRDGHLVNLPWALLAKDDVIVVKPGQTSPGLCESLDNDPDYPTLHPKEVYSPRLSTVHELFTIPKARMPLKNRKYKLLETPFLGHLRIGLEKSLDRPVTYYNQQRYFLVNICLERFMYIIVFFLVIIANFVRYMYLHENVGKAPWIEMFLTQPVAVTFSLLPFLFPIGWIGLNAFGMAKFKALFNTTSKISLTSEKDREPFAETDLSVEHEVDFTYRWSEIWDIFLDIITGKEIMMTRSANILHVFGCLSALCVVDKKGILSWPNPTAEKVFFLRSSGSMSQSSSLDSINSNEDADSTKPVYNGSMRGTVVEVLDLTHDHKYPSKIEFDDHDWKQHISFLKPLGLAILLNTCNKDTQESYNQFCSHITCEAMYNENLVPVTNRRCLCELAKKIGFVDQAQDIFALEQQLSTFRHLTDSVKRDKFARSLRLSTKLKFPFPHMFSIIVKELTSGSHQLLSQGTADVILDSCIDYWDGKDLCPLSPSDRKKVMDFYQRTSLTAYCTAFAYRPLTKTLDSKLSQIYLELPSDSKHLYMPYRSPTPLHCDFRSMLEPRIKNAIGQFHSTDSLLYSEDKEDIVNDIEGCFESQCNQIFMGMVTMQYQAQADMIQLIERLEKACIRFVHFSKENELRSRVFSEKMGLESGWNCHISLLSEKPINDKTNATETVVNNATHNNSSSDIFCRPNTRKSETEKPESSDEAQVLIPSSNLETLKPISFSAPSAINLEYSVVKFDEEVLERDEIVDNSCGWTELTGNAPDGEHSSSRKTEYGSRDSLMMQSIEGWQSLSCLTDSTEQSAPVNFDMSNRAKLPRGIENIKPHLESVDNVPLLVSLFTDCTSDVTCQMIRIMQEYGQTVCIIGSAANSDNMDIFMQADASIAVEPLYPQFCQKTPVYMHVNPVHGPSPIGLNRTLNSLPCSLAFKREDPVSIYHLILESRHFMLSLTNCMQFWICCVVTISFLQLAGILLMLPPILSIGQVMWLSYIIVPIICISLIGLPTDRLVIQRPAGKFKYGISTEMVIFVLWCYCAKFIPIMLSVLLVYGGTLLNFCEDITKYENSTMCLNVYPIKKDNESHWVPWEGYSYSILTAQHVTTYLLVLHLVVVSSTFVHREHLIWKRKPTENKVWVCAVAIIPIIQTIFSITNLIVSYPADKTEDFFIPNIGNIHWSIWVFSIISLPFTFLIVLLIKWREIKINLRYLRRARLDFGTKLGMNSPF